MHALTAIIPATNDPPTLDAALAAVRSAEQPPDEVIVVREPPHAGPAAARNVGAREAAGDILVFVDADVAVHRDAFMRIRRAFGDDDTLVALFGSYDDAPTERDVVSGFRNLLHHHVHQESAGAATTFWAGIGAVRRDVFLDVGGFDAERYPSPSIEDIDLGMRLHEHGFAIVLDPAVQGTHLKRWTLRSMVHTDLLRRGAPWVERILDGGSDRATLNLGTRHRVSALASVALVASVVRRRRAPALVALATLVAANRSFYGLLARRRGGAHAVAGVGLHVVHHVTAVLAVPVGVVAYLFRRSTRGRP